MDVPKVYKEIEETKRFCWLSPSDASIGSVQIYRATDYKSDALGSRTLIGSTAVSVTSYTDTSGSSSNLYRIQFVGTNGSSQLSEPIGDRFNELYTTFDKVKTSAHFGANSDIGSTDIYSAVFDATETVRAEFGPAVKKSAIVITGNNIGVAGQAYNFSNETPVYMVRRVFYGISWLDNISSSDYTVDYTNGVIKFSDSFINLGTNIILIEWVPLAFSNLVKNTAALELVESSKIVDGRNVTTPDAKRLNRLIDVTRESLRPKSLAWTNMDQGILGADYIANPIQRNNLYFN